MVSANLPSWRILRGGKVTTDVQAGAVRPTARCVDGLAPYSRLSPEDSAFMTRRSYVVGNWKMNNTLAEARALVAAVREGLSDASTVEVGIAPSTVLLMPMCRAVADSPIQLGAQNVYCEPSGAFTGETSPAMLLDAG